MLSKTGWRFYIVIMTTQTTVLVVHPAGFLLLLYVINAMPPMVLRKGNLVCRGIFPFRLTRLLNLLLPHRTRRTKLTLIGQGTFTRLCSRRDELRSELSKAIFGAASSKGLFATFQQFFDKLLNRCLINRTAVIIEDFCAITGLFHNRR